MPTIWQIACTIFWFWLDSIELLVEEIDAASRPSWPTEPDAEFRFARLFPGGI
jgi:hypothetical protein